MYYDLCVLIFNVFAFLVVLFCHSKLCHCFSLSLLPTICSLDDVGDVDVICFVVVVDCAGYGPGLQIIPGGLSHSSTIPEVLMYIVCTCSCMEYYVFSYDDISH